MSIWGIGSLVYNILGTDLIFWSTITAIGAFKVARILYNHNAACHCALESIEKSMIKKEEEEEEYDDEAEVEEEERMPELE